MIVLTVITLALLAAIFWQDRKTRSVSAWLLPACGVALAVREYYTNEWNVLLFNTAINVSLLVIQFIVIHAWMFFRHKRIMKLMDAYIGWGDVIFLLCIAPSFAPLNFCLFVTCGTLFSLLITMATRRTHESIPLAGHLSLFLGCGLIITQLGLYSLRFSSDDLITQQFTFLLT